jgi:hypothetical protein
VVLGVGCSHPGIEKILEASTAVDKHVHLVFGGLHLVTTPDPEITRLVSVLHAGGKSIRWRRVTALESQLLPLFAKLSVISISTRD